MWQSGGDYGDRRKIIVHVVSAFRLWVGLVLTRASLQFDPAPRAGEPLVSRRVPDYFLVSVGGCRVGRVLTLHSEDNRRRVDNSVHCVSVVGEQIRDNRVDIVRRAAARRQRRQCPRGHNVHVILRHTARSRQTSRSPHLSQQAPQPKQPAHPPAQTQRHPRLLRVRVRATTLPCPPLTHESESAPTEASRSPPRPQDETALVRYARLKRDQGLEPEKWAVKDTSVNIAAAFNQAHAASTSMNNPNSAWASGSQTNLNVPRSTSVEYEKETHSTSTRRLAPPPSRLSQRAPLSKQPSALTHVSDSEVEEQHSQSIDNLARGKSPFDQVLDISKRAINTATSFYLRQRSTEPADISAATTNGKESSLDYEELDREYKELQRHRSQEDDQSASRKASANNRRNRMSLDNKAYRPSHSDLEDSDDQISDDGKKRRKKIKKKDLGPGTLTSLPVAGYDKRRRRKRGSRGGEAELDGDDQESSIDSEQVSLHGLPS